MPAITRRRFLERVGSLPALVHFGRTRRAPFSEWKREFFRQSSVGAALEAGQSLPAGIPGDPKSRLTKPPPRGRAPPGGGSTPLPGGGKGNFEARAVHEVMDVMKDHGIAVTFGLEPYATDRGYRFANDVLYLLTKYGERRGWDAFLILRNAAGGGRPGR